MVGEIEVGSVVSTTEELTEATESAEDDEVGVLVAAARGRGRGRRGGCC